ncbi:hypothetical protein [Aspergillus creber narnavirus 1]|nr:hypothetical protein [Aspergillus creber narnavirus 1]
MECFELDPISAKLVQEGIVTINVIFTQDGADAWARACRRHPGLGVSPSDSILLKDLPEVFAKHSALSSPDLQALIKGKKLTSSSQALGKVPQDHKQIVSPQTRDQKVKESRGNYIDDFLIIPPTDAKRRGDMIRILEKQTIESCRAIIKKAKLDSVVNNGVVNSLPKDSLTRFDVERSEPIYIFSRFVAVASELGNERLVSRIRTSEDLRAFSGYDLPSWWKVATLKQKLLLLSSNKKFKVNQFLGGLNEELRQLIDVLPHPFRGDAQEMELYVEGEQYSTSAEEDN